MKNLPQRRARFMRLRIGSLAMVLIGGAIAVSVRAFELQVDEAPRLREMAEEQYYRDIQLSPKRGTIYDRNGAELAVSVEVDSVYANPRKLRAAGVDPAFAARKLSALLDVDAAVLRRRLLSNRYFAWVKRRVSPNESKAVAALGLPGVEVTPEARRFYPNRQLAAHLIGFANIDGRGIEGLELALDDRLRGSTDSVPAIRDRRGVIVFSEQLLDDRANQGDDIVLTIDKTIQHIAERELELAARTFEAHGGSIVVLDPRTGELLAVANYPTFNPNQPGDAPPENRRNRAITDRFEPGSTIKPFTVAGALARGVVRPDQEIDCEDGSMKVAEYTIHDTHKWESLTPGQILAYSSNIGTAKIGMALGRAALYRVLRNFGFGQESGLGLPGETGGILRHYKKWYEMDAATISFGQGMSATTLQMATSMAALANRGRLMKPTLIKRVSDGRGAVVQEARPEAERQVVPPWAAQLTADMLIAVTGEDGTGSEAALPGYLVAGKTGTAQKADYVHGGYAEGKWTSSFVGFAPAREPRLVIAVTIDEPMIAYYGGTVAGPTFRRVMEASLQHLGVPASLAVDSVAQKRARRARRRAREAAEAAKAQAAAEAEAEAQAQAQAAGEGGEEPKPPAALADDELLMPDLLGQTARGALIAAQQAGFSLEVKGSGVVVAQEPAPSEVVTRGSTVRLLLAPPPHVREQPPAEPVGAPPVQRAAPPVQRDGAAAQQDARLARVGGFDG